jgi:hypothetical protein
MVTHKVPVDHRFGKTGLKWLLFFPQNLPKFVMNTHVSAIQCSGMTS